MNGNFMQANQTNQPNRLEDLAMMFLANQKNQPQRETGPKMITAGGRVLGRDVSGGGWQDKLGQSLNLNQLATNFLMMQKMQKQRQFFGEIHKIMGASSDTETKKNAMRQLITQHDGQDYDLGIKETLWKDFMEDKTQAMVDREGNVVKRIEKGSKFQPKKAQEATSFQLQKRAQDEAFKMLGGTQMVGLDEVSRKQYEDLWKQLYNQWAPQFDISPLENVEQSTQQNPFSAEYPDAFLEDGVWKVIRNKKKYKIEE